MDENAFTAPFQLTKSMRRQIYPSIDPSNSALKATGKVVTITGAGGGLGGATAEAWATAGAACIVLVGRNAAALEETAQNVKKLGHESRVLVHEADVTSEADVKALYEAVAKKIGKTHVLINAAGTMSFEKGMNDIEPSAWWMDFETNVKGTFLMTQHFIKQCSEGTIINIVSSAGGLTVPAISAYSCAKLAQIKFGEYIHLENPHIRVFSVHPGIVAATHRGMVVPNFTPFAKDPAALTGGISLYLSTPKADYLNGCFVSVNWDVDEMAEHAAEINEKKLLTLGWLNAKLGPEGQPWEV